MPRATCRCGQALPVPKDPSERVVCPKCGSRVRVRFPSPSASDVTEMASPDGYIRFLCPCGRRLKVDSENPPSHGRCPDCGNIVPVPRSIDARDRMTGHPEAPTEEMSAEDQAALERWVADHQARGTTIAAAVSPPTVPAAAPPSSDRMEVGLRVCPRCGQPVRLGSEICRGCGTPVPKR